ADIISMATESVSSGSVRISSVKYLSGNGTISTNPVISAAATPAIASGPAYPDFTSTSFSGASSYYSGNDLHSDYATPSTIPGLFKIDGGFSDTSRIALIATKSQGKVLLLGSMYNWRNPADTTFSTLTQGTGYYNSGAFILFQK